MGGQLKELFWTQAEWESLEGLEVNCQVNEIYLYALSLCIVCTSSDYFPIVLKWFGLPHFLPHILEWRFMAFQFKTFCHVKGIVSGFKLLSCKFAEM